MELPVPGVEWVAEAGPGSVETPLRSTSTVVRADKNSREPIAVALLPAPDSRHVPALDGFRGAAIVMVLLFHSALLLNFAHTRSVPLSVYLRLTSGGWCGVDLFFVLSGFLITGILIKSRTSPRYFYNFYGRRVLRIFPLYYAFIFAMAVLLPLHSHSLAVKHAGGLGASYWLYLQNYVIAARGTWVGGNMTDVTWSLAIEEQFYLLWPLLVWKLDRKAMTWLCAAIVVASPLLRALLLHQGTRPVAIYVLTPTRIDGLATGAWVALYLFGKTITPALQRTAKAVALAGVGGVILLASIERGFSEVSPLTQVVGYSCLNAVFGAAVLLLLAPQSKSMLARAFGLAPLRFFGRYSYGLYLLHLPVLAGLREGIFRHVERHSIVKAFPTVALMAFQLVVIAGSVLAAWVSWNVLEKRCLRLKRYFADRGPFVAHSK